MSTVITSSTPQVLVSTESAILVEQEIEPVVIETGSDAEVIETPADTILVTEPQVTVIETAGRQGPPGPPGPPREDEMPYAKRVDEVPSGADTIYYIGEADPGAPDSAPAWRIQRVVLSDGGDSQKTWAGGNANFDKVWADRLTLSYS